MSGGAHTMFALPLCYNVEKGWCPCPRINKQHGGRRLTSFVRRIHVVPCPCGSSTHQKEPWMERYRVSWGGSCSAGMACGCDGVYVMFVNSVEANKHQQARQMSQRPCPRTHHIRRTVCCTLRSVCARTWCARVCSLKILYDSSCTTMRTRERQGRSWRDKHLRGSSGDK